MSDKKYIVNVYRRYGDNSFVRSAAVFDTRVEAEQHADMCDHWQYQNYTLPDAQVDFVVEVIKDYP